MHEQLIRDLRNLVKDGATPSRLIRHIVNELGDSASHWNLQEILMQAFRLPIVQISPYSASDQKGRVLNKTLLPEIVRYRSQWDSEETLSTDQLSWLDGLVLHQPGEIKEQLMNEPYPGLSEQSWAMLRPDEQESLLVQLASSRVLSERVELLSSLAERLQEKIDELEEKLESQVSV